MSDERAGVVAPPPLFFVAGLALGVALGRGRDGGLATDERMRRLGGAAIVAGLGIGAAGAVTLRRSGTNISPYAPTTALVTAGPFALSRNPLYVAMTSIYIGIALRTASIPAFVLLPVVLALLERGVVEREERYLERTFGDTYRAYRARVPRWF